MVSGGWLKVVSHRYHIDVFRSDEDRCWIANVPDLKSCSAHGDTPVEAVIEIEVAIGLCLKFALEKGFAIPEPSCRSDMSQPSHVSIEAAP